MSCCVAQVGECLKRFNLNIPLTMSIAEAYAVIPIGFVEFDLPANSFVSLRSVILYNRDTREVSPSVVTLQGTLMFSSSTSHATTIQRAVSVFSADYTTINANLMINDSTTDVKMKLNADSKVYIALSILAPYDFTNQVVDVALDFKVE